ncbi:hypothetical protein ACA910_004174 [Epithemia clementina (nom. ined.)]
MMQKETEAVEQSINRPSGAFSVDPKKSLISKDSGDQGRGPEDTDFSRDGSADSSLGKRKARDPEPESPGRNIPLEAQTTIPFHKKERTYYDDLGQDSPSSYPTHVMVPEHPVAHEGVKDEYTQEKSHPSAPLLTPDSISQRRQASFEVPVYARQQPYRHDSYHAPSYTDADYTRAASYSGSGSADHTRASSVEGHTRTRRWACDFCNIATFLSYEEACAHEEICARQHGAIAQNSRQPPPHPGSGNNSFGGHQPGHPPHGVPIPHHHQHGTGMPGMYHPGGHMPGQEVVTPPTPQRHYGSRWGSRGPPLPVLPPEHGYYHGYYSDREDPAYYNPSDQYYYNYGYGASHPSPPMHHNPSQPYHKRMLLAMPSDSESLSDRQCYVRSEMCEIFAATEHDVAARHSKGAQKLVVGQVGIRCLHCAHLRPRDRAERAVCYPSSISRIYQTVADMQRFHFEHCKEIPKHVSNVYKNLKTTRPRGVGSPQTYWIQSAKALGLVDTGGGIRFDTDVAKESSSPQQHHHRSGGSQEHFSTSDGETAVDMPSDRTDGDEGR